MSLTDDPQACALLLAESNLHRPRGAYGTPDIDAYTARLRGLLVPHARVPTDGHLMVRHDPISGMPDSTYMLYPSLDADGSLLMLEQCDILGSSSPPSLVGRIQRRLMARTPCPS